MPFQGGRSDYFFSLAALAIGQKLHEDVIPHFLRTFLTAAILHRIDRLIICFLSADPTIPLSGLLAVYVILILNPELIAEELFKLLGHFSLA